MFSLLCIEYARWLVQPAAAEAVAALELRPGSTLADPIAPAMCTRAVGGDVGAAKELAERTEGRVPAAVNVEGKIDYAAGRSATEQLMKKLGD